MALAFIETIYKEQSFEDLSEDLYYYYIPYEEIEAEDETYEVSSEPCGLRIGRYK